MKANVNNYKVYDLILYNYIGIDSNGITTTSVYLWFKCNNDAINFNHKLLNIWVNSGSDMSDNELIFFKDISAIRRNTVSVICLVDGCNLISLVTK